MDRPWALEQADASPPRGGPSPARGGDIGTGPRPGKEVPSTVAELGSRGSVGPLGLGAEEACGDHRTLSLPVSRAPPKPPAPGASPGLAKDPSRCDAKCPSAPVHGGSESGLS